MLQEKASALRRGMTGSARARWHGAIRALPGLVSAAPAFGLWLILRAAQFLTRLLQFIHAFARALPGYLALVASVGAGIVLTAGYLENTGAIGNRTAIPRYVPFAGGMTYEALKQALGAAAHDFAYNLGRAEQRFAAWSGEGQTAENMRIMNEVAFKKRGTVADSRQCTALAPVHFYPFKPRYGVECEAAFSKGGSPHYDARILIGCARGIEYRWDDFGDYVLAEIPDQLELLAQGTKFSCVYLDTGEPLRPSMSALEPQSMVKGSNRFVLATAPVKNRATGKIEQTNGLVRFDDFPPPDGDGKIAIGMPLR